MISFWCDNDGGTSRLQYNTDKWAKGEIRKQYNYMCPINVFYWTSVLLQFRTIRHVGGVEPLYGQCPSNDSVYVPDS